MHVTLTVSPSLVLQIYRYTTKKSFSDLNTRSTNSLSDCDAKMVLVPKLYCEH